MEEHNEAMENSGLSECNNRISDSNLEDDTEDYIQPSQPLSFQGSSLELVSKKSSHDNGLTEMNASTIDETLPFSKSVILTPIGDTTNDFIPASENPKRKMDNLDAPAEGECKKRLNLDDTSPLKASPDLFSTQSDLNDTIDVPPSPKVPESPSIPESQNVSLVPESPLRINETLDSENSVYVLSESEKCRVLQGTIAEDSPNDASVELCELDVSKSERYNSSVCEIRGEMKVTDTPNNNGNEVVLDTSGMTALLSPKSVGDIVGDKKMQSQLDDTIDIDEIEYYNPYSSEKTDGKEVLSANIPPLTDGLTSPMEPEAESTPIDTNPSKEGLRSKGVLKNISDEESARLQKHSTPENPLSKSLKINESTSSIENGTPPVQDDAMKPCEITFTMLLQVNCQVVMDPIKKEAIAKKILNVKEFIKKQPKPIFLEPYSDSSCKTKRLSSSSAGSVYSEKTGLPYALPGRPSPASVITESSSTSSLDLAKHTQIARREAWSNEYKIPMAMDDILPRYVEQHHRSSQRNDGNAGGKRKISVRIRKKSHWSHPPNNVLESSVTEQSSENNSDVKLPELKKSEEAKAVEDVAPRVDVESYSLHDGEEKEVERGDTGHKEGSPVKEGEEDGSPEGAMSEGLLVFARWTDKRYYPGKLVNRARFDRWEVKFDDETEKVVREDLILPLTWLTKGELVFTLVADKYLSGKITDIIREEEIKYKIELDESNDEVTAKKCDVCLNDVMAGIIREKFKPTNKSVVPLKSSDIDFDNVVIGKRIREQRTPIRTPTSIVQPGSSTVKKRRGLKAGEEVATEKRTPKIKLTPHQKKETSRSSGKRKPLKSDSPAENGTANGGPDKSEADAVPLTSKDATAKTNTKSGGKKRTRTINYDSDRSNTSSKKSKQSQKDDDQGPATQRKPKSSSKALINEFEKATVDAAEKVEQKTWEEVKKQKGANRSAGTQKSKDGESPGVRGGLVRPGRKPQPLSIQEGKKRKKKNP